MCTNPITIKNRTLHFTKENSPLYIKVPCGHCYECEQQKQQEWFVRNYFHWLEQSANSSFFYTLTYNNENIPKFNSCGRTILCFSKRNVQLFLKRLRKRLSKLGITLSYMISSEYGELYKRPHHHALFYLSERMNPYAFYKLVEETWQYGFVKYGDNVGQLMDVRGIRYVTKYITKDISYMREDGLDILKAVYSRYQRLLDYINYRYTLKLDWSLHVDLRDYKFYVKHFNGTKVTEDSHEFELSKTLLNKVRSIYNSIIPFHFQSTYLGCKQLDKLTAEEMLNERVNILQTDGSIRHYPLPRFYKRKLWYDAVENENDGKCNKYVLNDAGKKHFLDSLDMKIQKRKEQFQNALLLAPKVTDDHLKMINVQDGIFFVNRHDLTYFLEHVDLDLDVLAIYDVVFQGRLNYFENCELNETLIKCNYTDIVNYHLSFTADYDMGKVYQMKEQACEHLLDPFLFDNDVFFQPYDKLSTILNVILIANRDAENREKKYNEELARKTRELLTKLN